MALIRPKNSAIVKVDVDDKLNMILSCVTGNNRVTEPKQLAQQSNRQISKGIWTQTVFAFIDKKAQGKASETEYIAMRYVPVSNIFDVFQPKIL